jgi:hypothetical protein
MVDRWQDRLWCHLLPTNPLTTIDLTRTRPVYIAMSRSAKSDNTEYVVMRAKIATVWHAKAQGRPIRIILPPGILSMTIIVNGSVMMDTFAQVATRAKDVPMPYHWVQTTADQAACWICHSALGNVRPTCMQTAWSVSSFCKNALLVNALFQS